MKTEIVLSGLTVPKIEIPLNVTKTRDEALARANEILCVKNKEQQSRAVEIMGELKSIEKRMEASREFVGRPILEITRDLNSKIKDFNIPVQNEFKRIKPMVDEFQKAELERVEKVRAQEEEKRRALLEEQQRLQAELQEKAFNEKTTAGKLKAFAALEKSELGAEVALMESIKIEAQAVPTRASGMVVTKKWKHRIIDIKKVFTARPDLCIIEENAMAIRGMIAGGMRECDGMEIYEDVSTTVRL